VPFTPTATDDIRKKPFKNVISNISPFGRNDMKDDRNDKMYGFSKPGLRKESSMFLKAVFPGKYIQGEGVITELPALRMADRYGRARLPASCR